MAENQLLADTPVNTVIDTGVALADGGRAAGDYDNSGELDLFCTAYLTVQFDTTAPSAGTIIADLYVLPGDGATTEVFPNGGDGTVGNDFTPQGAFLVGSFEAIDPGTTADEVLGIPAIPLTGNTNRFVLVNTSGQQFDATYQLDIKAEKYQTL